MYMYVCGNIILLIITISIFIFYNTRQIVEEKATFPSPSQEDIVQLSKEAAGLLEHEVSIYDKSKLECVVDDEVSKSTKSFISLRQAIYCMYMYIF